MELILEISQLNLLRELQRNTSDRITYQRLTTARAAPLNHDSSSDACYRNRRHTWC
jgi:hypothetical protein